MLTSRRACHDTTQGEPVYYVKDGGNIPSRGRKVFGNQFDEHWVGGELTQPPPGDQGTNWGPGVTGGKEVSTGQGEGLGVCS